LTRRLAFLVVLAIGVLVALAVFHSAILRGCARLLIVDQTGGPVSHLVLVDGDRRHDLAADFVRGNPAGRILLIEAGPNTLVECGILPADEVLDRLALVERGVPDSAIELISGSTADQWRAIHALQRWLGEHPDAHTAVLCNRFDSRLLRAVADAVLAPDQAQRVAIWALPNREFDERNWWYTRDSARSFVYAWLRLAFHAVQGESQGGERRWDPDEYEKQCVMLGS
jgi:hypothetical protein